MKRKIFLIVAIVSLVNNPEIRGQSIGPSTLNAAGGSGTISGKEFEWSIGEMTMVSTLTSSTIVVTQGILQPRSAAASTPQIPFASQLQVYPNPSSSIVNVRLNVTKDGKLNYRLTDAAGKIVQRKSADIKPGTSIQQLDISELAAAIYMLEVTFADITGNEETMSFKIQKLQ